MGCRLAREYSAASTYHNQTDSETGPAAFSPIVINQTAVRRFGFASATAAIGQRIMVLSEGQPSEIIGVVTDSPHGSIRAPIEPTVFYVDEPASQLLSLKIDPAYETETLRAVDELVNRVQPSRPNQRFAAEQGMRGLYADVESDGLVFSACAVIALILASLGLFGLSAFSAVRREKEIGVRKLLGASSLYILRLLGWELTKPVLWANVFAWPVAYFVMQRWPEGFANHVDMSVDIFLLAGGAALVIAWLTVLGHLIGVARARPVEALRSE